MHDIDAEEEIVQAPSFEEQPNREVLFEEPVVEKEIIEPEKVIEPEEVVIEAPVKPFNPKNRLYLRTGIMPK
jgi:hypothetical protein